MDVSCVNTGWPMEVLVFQTGVRYIGGCVVCAQREWDAYIGGLPVIPWGLRSGPSPASVLVFLGCCGAAPLYYDHGGCYYYHP